MVLQRKISPMSYSHHAAVEKKHTFKVRLMQIFGVYMIVLFDFHYNIKFDNLGIMIKPFFYADITEPP